MEWRSGRKVNDQEVLEPLLPLVVIFMIIMTMIMIMVKMMTSTR